MRFVVLSIGKSKHKFVQAGIDHYAQSIQNMAELELVELKDSESRIDAEAQTILDFLERKKWLEQGKNRLIVLDEKGRQYTSQKFSQSIDKWELSGTSRIIFLVGGAFGVDAVVKEKASSMLALSESTFPHDLARLFLLEQIYRALHIKKGTKYHHE